MSFGFGGFISFWESMCLWLWFVLLSMLLDASLGDVLEVLMKNSCFADWLRIDSGGLMDEMAEIAAEELGV